MYTCPVYRSLVLTLLFFDLQAFNRFLSPVEMMSSHCIPTTSHHADLAGTPRVNLDNVLESQVIKMSGNAMNLACLGSMLLAILFGLEFKTQDPLTI